MRAVIGGAGRMLGVHPWITLVAAGGPATTHPGLMRSNCVESPDSRVVASLDRTSARSAAALISALHNSCATCLGLYFIGGRRSFGSLAGMVGMPPQQRVFLRYQGSVCVSLDDLVALGE